MGDISFDFDLFLETLKQLLTNSNLDFTMEEKYQLQSLAERIKYLRMFLRIMEKKRDKLSEEMKMMVQIKDAVSKAKKVVEQFIVVVSKGEHASDSLREHKDHLFLDLERVRKDITYLEAKGKQNYDEMGNISLHLFLDILKQLLTTSDLDVTREEKIQLRSLEKEIKDLRGLLNVVEMKHNKRSQVRNLVLMPIIDVENLVMQIEDVENLFVAVSKYEHKDQLFVDLERVKKGIKNLTFEVTQICKEIFSPTRGDAVRSLHHSSTGSSGIGASGSLGGSNPIEVVEEKVVVGFEEEVATLVERLLDTVPWNGDIISIVGPGGCGKTTLAREVYDHPVMSIAFEIRAWVVVSQDYDRTMKRDLLIDILKSVFPENHIDYEKSSEDDLGEKLLIFLQEKKHLIVLDNVWGNETWNDIRRSIYTNSRGSKVVFTSRLREVDHELGYRQGFHPVEPLSKSGSWELLEAKVFGMKPCPPELVEIGKKIAHKCDGLPLAIVIIAGILATGDKILNAWEEIAKDVSSIIAQHEGCMELLEPSYNRLPSHLKVCFLYIGAHPEDYEISVRELTWLWIAEGFIQQVEEGKSLEGVAGDYLQGLINSNLVMIARRSSIGKIKTCRIHDLLRKLCLKKATEDNFLAQINGDDSSVPSATNKHHRLFVFRQFFDKFFFSRPYPQNLRSFLCLGSRHSRIELYMSFFVETFKLLRVFSFVADECQGEILRGQLVHLRYLALRLPKGKLFCSPNPFHFPSSLEFLNIQASCMDKISLPRDIVKMVKLRHLYSKAGIFEFHHVYYDEDERNMLDSLQTLHRICICEHCLRFLERTPNLRKLGLTGDPDRKGDDVLVLPNLEFLNCLEILHVESTHMASTRLKLPPTLTRLSLKQTNLKWEQLSILQELPGLKVLKLLAGACTGPVWDTRELEGFIGLKYLKLDSLDIEEWIAWEDQFPRLEILVIWHCKELKGIPIEFVNLNELHTINVEYSSQSVEESVEDIQEGTRHRRGEEVNLILRFNGL